LLIELGVILPIFKRPAGFENLLDHGHHLMAGDESGVGDVVGSEWGVAVPQIEAGDE
jgi:hypothetical protein